MNIFDYRERQRKELAEARGEEHCDCTCVRENCHECQDLQSCENCHECDCDCHYSGDLTGRCSQCRGEGCSLCGNYETDRRRRAQEASQTARARQDAKRRAARNKARRSIKDIFNRNFISWEGLTLRWESIIEKNHPNLDVSFLLDCVERVSPDIPEDYSFSERDVRRITRLYIRGRHPYQLPEHHASQRPIS